MKIPFGDLQRQYLAIKPELDAAAARVLASGWYILGPEVRAFEAAFAAYCGAAHAIGVANGTEALFLAMAALGVGPGDEVITVANAAVYEPLTILQLGARPVFVDVDERSHTMAPELLAAAITPRTRAIMPVHLYGRMADMDAIMAIAGERGLPVIEDAAQAHGALWRGRRAGSIGAVGCFSFYPSKNLGALGDGGAIVTSDAALAEKLRRLREYGWAPRYYLVEPGGINSRLDELQAALLGAKLAHLDAWNDRRRAIARRYSQLLAGCGLGLPEIPPNDSHVFHLYVVRAPGREQLQARLAEHGVGALVHYPLPAHLQPIYAGLAEPGSLPTTERLAHEVLSLPIYPELSDAEVEAVAAAVREALG
ncbi:MAG TPA: DegT/DnrJ/EryC1/StrS family aminotransferase [Kouleothrix sp.]|uniref:DegT/DnrJ/EryC1/StrS family aminotransferase n=1 Tax=Kouleothrix sp. TaxID=2779161 RepID=UPI002CB0B7C0|nr:DegT/DnrJ/EryC1/StrS family aminotransferase [Kouleothrix sp.]